MSESTGWALGFGETDAVRVGVTGGKGSSLARLFQAGFPVPEGFVVTAAAYRAFRARDDELAGAAERLDYKNPGSLERQCAQIRERLAGLDLPAALSTELDRRLPGLLAKGPVAVRSSSTFEDLAGAAFAGQHDTYLNRSTPESVANAVRRCFASLWEDRAVRYRRERGLGADAASMAVVVQSMVPSETAGVVFTIQPVTGDLDTMMVNAAFGLGETVVSGEGEVDQFILDRKTGRVLEARIAEKSSAVAGAGDGTRTVDVPADRRRQPSLTEEQLRELARLALAVERSAGFPQDIEWAYAGGRLHLLQSRPVTRFPERWTRDESAERFPNAVSPLTWDYARDGFHESLAHSLALMRMPPFEGRWFEAFNGYVYGNQTAVKLFTGNSPARFETLEELARELQGMRDRFGWVEELPVAWARDLDRYLIRLGALSAVPVEELAEARVWEHVQALDRTGREYFLPNIAISLTHALLHRTLFRFLGLVAGGDAPRLYDGLMRFCETKTSLVNADMASLARLARRDPALERLLCETDRRAIWDEDRLDAVPAFRDAFRRFLEDHGHREVDWDAAVPTWSGQPWVVLENVRLLLESPEIPDATARAFALREEQAAAERELAGRVPEDLRFFASELVRLCRVYTALDDLEHYQTTRLNPPFRRALLALGARLAGRGALARAEDIFFLRRRTLEALMAGELAPAEALRQARAGGEEYERQRTAEPPWTREESGAPPAAGALTGLPGSPGVAEGPVFRVLSSADFGRFPAGSVLVARTTNPAWTPLFYSACAVVTESGGPLSHGAVTAREVGIPAVMAVHGVLAALPDGTRVRVNGSRGSVERLKG